MFAVVKNRKCSLFIVLTSCLESLLCFVTLSCLTSSIFNWPPCPPQAHPHHPPSPTRQLEAEPLNGDNWGKMVGPCLTNLLTQQSTDCSWDLVTQQAPIAQALAIISRKLAPCASYVVICSESIDRSLPCVFSHQPCPFIPLTQPFWVVLSSSGCARSWIDAAGRLVCCLLRWDGWSVWGPHFLCAWMDTG